LSKLCGLVLVLCVPCLIQGALLGALYPGGYDAIMNGALKMGAMALVLSFSGMIGASLTRDKGNALLVVFLVAISASILNWGIVRIPILSTLLLSLQRSLSHFQSIDTLLESVLILLLLGVFLWQYKRPCRKYRYGVFYSLLIAVLMFVGNITPMPIVPQSTMSPPEGAFLELDHFNYGRTDQMLPGFHLSASGSDLDVWWEGTIGSYRNLRAQVQWLGLPEGQVYRTTPYLSVGPNGEKLLPPRGKHGSQGNREIRLSDTFKRSLFPGDPDGPIGYNSIVWVDLFSDPLSGLKETDLPAEFTTTFVSQFYQPEVVRLTVDSNLRLQIGSTRFQMQSMESLADKVELRFSYVSSGFRMVNFDSVESGFLVVRDPVTARVAFARSLGRQASNFMGLVSVGEFYLDFKESWIDVTQLAQLEWYHVQFNPVGVNVHSSSYVIGEDRN
jgi:hypothetical protein